MSLQINQATFHLNVNHFNCLSFKLDSTRWKQMMRDIHHSNSASGPKFSTKAGLKKKICRLVNKLTHHSIFSLRIFNILSHSIFFSEGSLRSSLWDRKINLAKSQRLSFSENGKNGRLEIPWMRYLCLIMLCVFWNLVSSADKKRTVPVWRNFPKDLETEWLDYLLWTKFHSTFCWAHRLSM